MYLMICKKTVNGKLYRSAKIAETYRKPNNKYGHKIIKNLGPVKSDEDLIKFKKITEQLKKGNTFVNLDEIKIKSSKNYGIYHTTGELLNKYELDTILKKHLNSGKHVFDVFQIIKALIVNRLEDPCSKLSAYDWMKNEYPEEINPELQNIYSSLDKLIRHKEDIEIELFETLKDKLNLNTKKVHYDLTSSYFEGHNCKIAMYGYSRDHRPDRQQIVIGLVMVDGIPIYHEVFEGNTADKSTLEGIAEKLKNKFNLKSPTIIADRGLITQENLQMLESNGQKYILGFSKRNNNLTKELIVQDIKSNKNQSAKIIKTKDNRKYVLCLDNNTRNERLEILENMKEKINEKLNELKTKFEKSQASDKKNKITNESLILQVDKILGKNRRLFDLDYLDKTFSFDVNKVAWDYEQKSAGKFLLVTNTDLKADEVMKSYKELINVEQGFDCLKNKLLLRPVYHYKTSRVEAHVFICVLALLIEKIIERFSSQSGRKVITELKRIRICEIKAENVRKRKITDLTPKAKSILDELKINIPLIYS